MDGRNHHPREDVKMVVVHTACDGLDPLMSQRGDEFLARDGPRLARKNHRFVHEAQRQTKFVVVRPGRGRVLVITLDVLAVKARSPAPRVAPEPCAIGVPVDVIPPVPRVDDAFVRT